MRGLDKTASLEGDGLGAQGVAGKQEEAQSMSQRAVSKQVYNVEALRVVGLQHEGSLLCQPAHEGRRETGELLPNECAMANCR